MCARCASGVLIVPNVLSGVQMYVKSLLGIGIEVLKCAECCT